MSRMQPLSLDCKGLTVQELESWGSDLTGFQKSINWWIGDLAIAARSKLGADNYSQAFPPDTSPGLIQRCEAVARAYRPEDRNPLASWSIHMQHANHPDRVARVQAAVDAGRTTDEEREKIKQEKADTNRPRWLLAVDVHYFLHRFWFSGAAAEAAMGVADWIQRTVERLKEKGLTDCVCCFDSPGSFRKELTKEWEDRYKDRPPKPVELVQQLQLVQELLRKSGLACVSIDGYEADDCMASYAKQFPGKVTLLTQDKDCRQCLSDKVNMLLDVEWSEDPTSGERLPNYKWLSAKQHTEATGISPNLWVEFQALMGDATDGIKGAPGIGEKGAADIVKLFGTVEASIAAAKAEDEKLKPKQRASLIAFSPKAEVTRKLVTLVDTLELPTSTRI